MAAGESYPVSAPCSVLRSLACLAQPTSKVRSTEYGGRCKHVWLVCAGLCWRQKEGTEYPYSILCTLYSHAVCAFCISRQLNCAFFSCPANLPIWCSLTNPRDPSTNRRNSNSTMQKPIAGGFVCLDCSPTTCGVPTWPRSEYPRFRLHASARPFVRAGRYVVRRYSYLSTSVLLHVPAKRRNNCPLAQPNLLCGSPTRHIQQSKK